MKNKGGTRLELLSNYNIFAKAPRSQITIFIIVGIVIVVAILVFFFFYGKVDLQKPNIQDPQGYISQCVKKAVEPSINIVLANGGLINPESTIMYGGENYTYLCYQKNFYLTCINQIPNLKAVIEKQIQKNSEDKIVKCFSDLKTELQAQNYVVSDGVLSYSVELAPKTIILHIQKQFDISKEQGSKSFNDFDTRVLNPLYDLAMTAREIVNQESQYCNFEYNGFMLLYPDYDIKRISYDDSRIYQLFDRNSGKEFKFAVRGCAFPPGL